MVEVAFGISRIKMHRSLEVLLSPSCIYQLPVKSNQADMSLDKLGIVL